MPPFRAKYPLAIVHRAVKILGLYLALGYGIGCAFEKTIGTSSLGPSFSASLSCCLINSYHGYTHNYACQYKNLPSVIEEVSLKDWDNGVSLQLIQRGSRRHTKCHKISSTCIHRHALSTVGWGEIPQPWHYATQQLLPSTQNCRRRSTCFELNPSSKEHHHRRSWHMAGGASRIFWDARPGTNWKSSSDYICWSPTTTSHSTVSDLIRDPEISTNL